MDSPLAGLVDEQLMKRRAFKFQATLADRQSILAERLPVGWGLWDRHVEDITDDGSRRVFMSTARHLTARYPKDVRIVSADALTDEQRDALGAANAGKRQHLAIRITAENGGYTAAAQELVDLERGGGPVGEKLRAEQLMAQADQLRSRIRKRVLRDVPNLIAEDDLPADWVDRMIHTLKHEPLGAFDDAYGNGPARRHLPADRWDHTHLSKDSLTAAAHHLGFTRVPARRA